MDNILNFFPNNFKDIIEILSIIIALYGLFLTLSEYMRSNKVKKAAYLDELVKRMETDTEIRDMNYSFQYGNFKYDENFHDSEMEKTVDRTLEYYSYVCYLKYKKIITKDEFLFLGIYISQALRNHDLKAYLYHLYHFECDRGQYDPKGNGKQKFSFRYLIDYAEEIGEISNDFFEKGKLYKNKKYLVY